MSIYVPYFMETGSITGPDQWTHEHGDVHAKAPTHPGYK
jgi:hypothetical protein